MKDKTPAKRTEPQPDPVLDTSGDSDEPAFEWMKAPEPSTPTASTPTAGTPASGRQGGSGSTAAQGAAAQSAVQGADSTAAQGAGAGGVLGRTGATRGVSSEPAAAPQAESRADRKAAEAAVEPSGAQGAGTQTANTVNPAGKGQETLFSEPLPTSALQVRPPQEEVERRNAERESAANAKPVMPRVMQVLLAVFYPIILLVLAVRAVTSPLFLWVEYNRPGFPGDGYGFSTDDRMTYGSYAVDYLSNWAAPRYLGELVNRSGERLFKEGEVSHMADVKLVILSAFGAGTLLAILSIIAISYLRRRSPGGVRRGLFAGSIVALVIILGLGALAVLGWQQFFTEFHRLFFASGSWTFALEDTLIRLFPGQFWIDAGITIAALVLLVALVTLILTWPTRRRRGLVKAGRTDSEPSAVAADQP